MRELTVYTMGSCPYCIAAKGLVEQRDLAFTEVRLTQNDDAAWASLLARSGMRTVLQIFVGDHLVEGFTYLAKLDQTAGLSSLKAILQSA